MVPYRYFVLYKPFGILSQFSGEPETTLGWLFPFPKEVYPVGRLDKDSEGLLLLTDDKALNEYLLHPSHGHSRTYYVQVEGIPSQEALQALADGVTIRVDGREHLTLPAEAALLPSLPELPERHPPIRFRKSVPDSWLSLRLVEGKNRQVRRMTAAVGLPTLRLVRWSMEELDIAGYQVGEVREFEQETLFQLLKIDKKRLYAAKRSEKLGGVRNFTRTKPRKGGR
ncbi:pseudouridine synthase [Nitritalea halalkaliphila LW7]|uniref:Pseudouridine synthase n=1 Tax=Nitritalea halalkaliphila LW7 TaxID=1189621 RepID=I5C5J3_9BACT|nr:pseudouridine synthase [Nitritalea halalkaliphila]EIM77095.1 pseudouridine synthase [Nitritalea halalkaliphila LW7]